MKISTLLTILILALKLFFLLYIVSVGLKFYNISTAFYNQHLFVYFLVYLPALYGYEGIIWKLWESRKKKG